MKCLPGGRHSRLSDYIDTSDPNNDIPMTPDVEAVFIEAGMKPKRPPKKPKTLALTDANGQPLPPRQQEILTKIEIQRQKARDRYRARQALLKKYLP